MYIYLEYTYKVIVVYEGNQRVIHPLRWVMKWQSMTNTIMTLKIRLGKPLYDIGLGLRYILSWSSWKLYCNETWPGFRLYFRSSLFIFFLLSSSSSFVSLESLDSLAPQLWKHCLARQRSLGNREAPLQMLEIHTVIDRSSFFTVALSAIMISSILLYWTCCIKSRINHWITWYKCVYSK